MRFTIIYILFCVICSMSLLFSQEQTVGVFIYDDDVYEGYTLFSPSKNTYLIDNCGNVINQWASQYRPGLAVYLLEDGLLLRTNKVNNNKIINESRKVADLSERIDIVINMFPKAKMKINK